MDRDPDIVTSGLSRTITQDGVTVEVNIFRLETDPEWMLEVVNEAGTSDVWEIPFRTDEDAFEAFQRTVAMEGMRTFLDNPNVIPFPKR